MISLQSQTLQPNNTLVLFTQFLENSVSLSLFVDVSWMLIYYELNDYLKQFLQTTLFVSLLVVSRNVGDAVVVVFSVSSVVVVFRS